MTSRALGRKVHIYNAKDTTTVLGGIHLTTGMTKANLYSMVEIVFIFDNDYTLSSESGATIQRDDHPLKKGKYFINTAGSLRVNNEPWLFRTMSVGDQAPAKEFIHAVRERDYGWITIPGARGSISSVQNGMLLREDISTLFECYYLSINPDDGYKIVSFMGDENAGISGTCLDKTVLGNPERPVDQLLRWHFRQAVLANVRGEKGEPYNDPEASEWSVSDWGTMSGSKTGKNSISTLSLLAASSKA
ncbi:hypothetical protein B9Z19DRAFT_1061410 [Tuber borchii]|uniref:HNH nuclease domain-containing protein n=1 Tax=Tuber borchii TaxID=42251 RepID=A0A2T7A5F8_TUBBO|nr:hypothetical protein B9Z19DRAFT_1061410 [Tuber borchii]